MDTNPRQRPPLSLNSILDALAEKVEFRLRLSAAADVREMQLALVSQIYHMRSEMVAASTYSDLTDWTDDDVEYFVLSDDSNQLNALFRYCIASKRRLFDVADMYADAAVRQYTLESARYNKVWGELIPEEIRKRARKSWQ